MLVTDFLEKSAARLPEKTALVIEGRRHSYAEIDSMASSIAGALVSDGLKKGERAAIFADNSVEAVASIFAVLKAGGVFLMINPTTKAEKLAFILNNSRASALIGQSARQKIINEAIGSAPHVRTVYLTGGDREAEGGRARDLDAIIAGGTATSVKASVIDADLATIIYTSGSTGDPKGVVMTHLNMVSAANSITEYLENTEDDIILNTLPLSFDYGLYQALMSFKAGATLVLEKSFSYPYKVIETLIREKVTGFPIVPTISAVLLQMEEIKKHSFSLRYISNTAAALPPAHILRLKEFFPGARIYSMYGLTECKRVAYLPPDEIDRRPSSVGKAMPNTEAFVADEEGRRAPPGVVGELVVRGSSVMQGYWELPEETAKKIRPGEFPGDRLLYTGDLFKTDEDGYLYFVGRKDDIIKSRGEKVSPKEVENVLYSMDGVVEAAVIGVPDEVMGEAVKAVIVAKEGSRLTDKEVMRFCAAHLESFCVPKSVEFVNALPKTDTGKIRKKGLK